MPILQQSPTFLVQNVGPGAPIPGNAECSCVRHCELHRMEVRKEGLSLGPPNRLHRRFQRRAARVCHDNGELDRRRDPPLQRASFRSAGGEIRIRFQRAALGQWHTKRTVDARNGCTLALLARVIQSLLRRALRNVSRYVGPDSTKHRRGSPCCDRTYSFALRGLPFLVGTLCCANGMTKTLDAWRAYSMLCFMLFI
jgi:hypothetical protein